MYDYGDIEFAMCGVRVLGLILLVAIVAFAAKSRTMFIAGSLGSFLGYVVPEGRIHINGTVEACFMGYLEWTASHVLQFSIIGAVAACVAAGALQRAGRLPKQYSLRTLLLATTAIAIVAAMARYLAM